MTVSPVTEFETGHHGTVHDAQYDYYGKQIATCSSDRLVKVFSIEHGGETATTQHVADLVGHSGPVWEVKWSHPRHGTLLASCGYDRTIIVWQCDGNGRWQQMYQSSSHTGSVNSIDWAPVEVGLALVGGSADGSLSVTTYNATDGSWGCKRIENAHPVGVTSVSWSPMYTSGAGMRVASGGCDCTVKVWRYDEGGQEWVQEGPALVEHSDWVRSVEWAPGAGLPSSPMLVSAGQDGKVVVWKEQETASGASTWMPTVVKNFGKPVWKASWSTNGNLLAVTDADQQVTLWNEVTDGVWKEVPSSGHH